MVNYKKILKAIAMAIGSDDRNSICVFHIKRRVKNTYIQYNEKP